MNIVIDRDNGAYDNQAFYNLLKRAGFAYVKWDGELTFTDKKQGLGDLKISFAKFGSILSDVKAEWVDLVIAKQYNLVEALGYNYESQTVLSLVQRFQACSVPLVMAKRADIECCFTDDRDKLERYRVGSTNPRYLSGWAIKYGVDLNVVPISDSDLNRYGSQIMKEKELDVLAYCLEGVKPSKLGLEFQETIANVGLSLCALRGKKMSPQVMSFVERLVIAEKEVSRLDENLRGYEGYLPMTPQMA